MDLYLWWLGLLPVFFGLGWLAARVDMNSVLKQAAAVPTVFFKALDALVDNQTDVAARSLAEMARQTNDADLQLTLGKLYRRRGENDLAIRLHQKMLDTPDLVGQKRDVALFELAQDFHKSGLVDRAESLLLTLQVSHVALSAKRLLLSIYQQDRNWHKAIEMATDLRDDAHTFSHEVAQFYCELAQSAFYHTDYQTAKSLIKEAFVYNRRCVRANIILGDVAEAQGDDAAAIEAWQAIEQQNADYLGMVAERLFNAYYRLGLTEEGLARLSGYLHTFPQLNLVEVLYEKMSLQDDRLAAVKMIRAAVQRRPNLMNLYRLVEIQMAENWTVEAKTDADLMRGLVSKYSQKLSVHRCKRCHFKSRTFFWHCPACAEWESFTPNLTEE